MQVLGIGMILVSFLSSYVAGDVRWWPVQKAPKQIVRTIWHEEFETSGGPNDVSVGGYLSPTHMMVESVAGLAAAAVNEGTCDEMVWISVGNSQRANRSYTVWYDQLKRQLSLKDNGVVDSWGLIKRFRDKGVIRGYILYHYDTSAGDAFVKRESMDISANIATVMSGIYGGILIDEKQEKRAKELGLKLLADARGMTMQQCFDSFKSRLNRNIVLIIDPKIGHCRDYAIANRCMVVYGGGSTVEAVLAWLNPLAMVLGWNYLPENESTILTSRYGHLQTATNWIVNLPLLSAMPEANEARPKYQLDPSVIDYDDTQSATAFVLTDGDNLSWLVGDFCFDPNYWTSEAQGKFAMGWTSCPSNMAQVSPETLRYLFASEPQNTTFIEYGNGYHYPDYLGKDRDTEAVLTAHARRSWAYMSKNGINVFGFICMDLDSKAAQRAYEIYAREMPGLVGMIGVQYYPYEGGRGKVYWVKNKADIEIPVVTCRYALWANYSQPTGGPPAKVARLLNDALKTAVKENKKDFSWTVVHAWSGFKKISDNNEVAENGEFGKSGNETGMTAVQWCIDRLDKRIKVVSPEELIWRIRMEHNPKQTAEMISQIKQR